VQEWTFSKRVTSTEREGGTKMGKGENGSGKGNERRGGGGGGGGGH